MRMNITLANTAMALLLLVFCTLPAAASDYTLGVFGNANEDDTINMQDVTYTELIILEYRDKTELADAKYDGKINMQDVTQIELVILGKEKEITVIDSHEGYPRNTVTVEKPVERMIPFADNQADGIKVLGAVDRVVGVGTEIQDKPILYPVMSELPGVGGVWGAGPDIEAIISLNPDILLTYEFRPSPEVLDYKLAGTDIKVVRLTFDIDMPQFVIMGYILGKRDEAEEFIDFFDSHIGSIEEKTEGLTDDEKPRVYIEWCQPAILILKILSGINHPKQQKKIKL